ncbi:MAG TPA: NAD(P)H nitroreductase [Pseudonocardia sp.]|nr:NAD(P)H nitroreductase [Pseudonocardia sp.]
MIVDDVERGTVRSAVELACRAPSVHNSQPWLWRTGEQSLHLYADRSRWLPATDADRRDLVLSCGAALHHLRVALAAAGVRATVHRVPNPDDPDHLAAVGLHGEPVAEADLGLATAIPNRRSDRRAFSGWPVPEAFLRQLVARAADQGALLRVIEDPRSRAGLMAAIREAEALQEQVPGYRTEIAMWTGGRADEDGVPAANLLREAPTDPGHVARRFGEGELEPGAGDEGDGAVLAVIGTASDDRLSQLRAGEALSAVLLTATEFGLAACPLSQPLEIGPTRLAIRDGVLDGTLSPQVVVRVGWAPPGPPLPQTPRRPVDDVLQRMPG